MEEDREWGRALADYFDILEMGWTAWSWSNEPYLVSRFTPTKFGDIVLEQLRKTLRS